MSLNGIDLEALQRDLEEFAREQRQRGWFKRNWLWFVPVLLLAIVVLGGGFLYWSLFIRVYHLPVCQSAMRTIQADKSLQNSLGQPIQPVYWPSREAAPSARIEESEIDVRWNIEGPKSHAKAHVLAKLRQGQWEIIQLEVLLAGDKRVSLADAAGGADEAPAFAPPKPGTDKPSSNMPAPEINLSAPPDDGPGKP